MGQKVANICKIICTLLGIPKNNKFTFFHYFSTLLLRYEAEWSIPPSNDLLRKELPRPDLMCSLISHKNDGATLYHKKTNLRPPYHMLLCYLRDRKMQEKEL